MKMTTLVTAGFALLLVSQSGSEAQNAKKTAPGWLSSYDQARAQARQSGKPIFLVFR